MMPENKPQLLNEADKANESFFGGLYQNLRLIGRLLLDKRVPIWLKILPVGALIYLIWPVDFAPIVPLDDALVLYLGGHFFIQLCPPDVVQEHRDALWEHVEEHQTKNDPSEKVIDGDYIEVDATQARDKEK